MWEKMTDNKLERLEKMFTPEMKRHLQRLNNILPLYRDARGVRGDMYIAMLLLSGAKRGAHVFTSFVNDLLDTDKFFSTDEESENIRWYVLFTSPEQAAIYPDEDIILVDLCDVVARCIKGNEFAGININPYGNNPCMIRKEILVREYEREQKVRSNWTLER